MTIVKIGGALALTGIVLAGGAKADVLMEQKIIMDAAGALSMMGSTGQVKIMVSGERGRTENRMEPNSGFMRSLAKNLDTATIVRLDEEKVFNLMPDQQQYSEVTFEQMRAQYQQAMDQLEQMQEGGGLPVSEDECEWSEPVIEIKQTGESEKFAGVKASQTLITATQTCTVPKEGKSCEMGWTLDYWMAKRMPGDDEIRAFQSGMAKAMGGDEQLAMVQMQARGLLAMFSKGWDEVLEESGDLDGFPVKTVMSMEIGGESCTTGAGQPIAMDDIWGDAANAGLNAAAGSAASQAGSAAGQAAAESMGDSVGGSIAGSALGAASRELVSGMFKKFGKKKKKEEEPKPAAANNAAGGSVVLFRISTELTRIEEGSVPASEFEVPAGWKKVEATGF